MKRGGAGNLNGFLDAGSHLKGELLFEDTFRVEGRFTGTVVSRGELYVGERGEVEGEVRVGRLYVAGRVEGQVEASERVEIAPGGEVRGELVSPVVRLEEGAFFEGHCRMEGATSTPQAKVTHLR